jgi:hypothetical protein
VSADKKNNDKLNNKNKIKNEIINFVSCLKHYSLAYVIHIPTGKSSNASITNVIKVTQIEWFIELLFQLYRYQGTGTI